MTLHKTVFYQLKNILENLSPNPIEQLNNALRFIAKYRSHIIQNTFVQNSGTKILNGPFEGMDFIERSAEGCHIAKLLGCYEQPLFPFIQKAIDTKYPTILNIGCAEGYYAVGMARCMRNTTVHAFDTDENARHTTKRLAIKNGVEDQIKIEGFFQTEDFNPFYEKHATKGKILLLCDIEGAEERLLDIDVADSLRYIDIILESHEVLFPGITEKLINRFKESHDIVLIQDNGQRLLKNTPKWFLNISHLDQLLATWEWRSGPTPWLVLEAKKGNNI